MINLICNLSFELHFNWCELLIELYQDFRNLPKNETFLTMKPQVSPPHQIANINFFVHVSSFLYYDQLCQIAYCGAFDFTLLQFDVETKIFKPTEHAILDYEEILISYKIIILA